MIKELLAKLAGKRVAKKLQEGAMSEDSKPWYRSMGVLGGAAVILRAIYEGVAASGLVALPPIPPFVDAFLLSVFGTASAYGRWRATQKIG